MKSPSPTTSSRSSRGSSSSCCRRFNSSRSVVGTSVKSQVMTSRGIQSVRPVAAARATAGHRRLD
eukprot:1365980-Lingulodinium_polyedra.AAC.1